MGVSDSVPLPFAYWTLSTEFQSFLHCMFFNEGVLTLDLQACMAFCFNVTISMCWEKKIMHIWKYKKFPIKYKTNRVYLSSWKRVSLPNLARNLYLI